VNRVEARHIAEATDEAHDWLDRSGNMLDAFDDERLAARLKCVGDLLLAHDAAGHAEQAHETARELAGIAIFYMARGLS
jgi:hypothetical protein